MKIRVVKTASKAKAVQVVRYQNNKRVVLQHIGSAHSAETLNDLLVIAQEWIRDYTKQLSIFPMKIPTGCYTSTTALLLGLSIVFFTIRYVRYRI